MGIYNSKEEFDEYLNENILDGSIDSSEFVEHIRNSRGTDFYDLCSKFADISLNASKWIDDKGILCEKYNPLDYKKAKDAFSDYIHSKKIDDVNGLLHAIYLMHRYAVSWDDKREKGGLIRSNDNDFNGPVRFFCEIPDEWWKTIADDII